MPLLPPASLADQWHHFRAEQIAVDHVTFRHVFADPSEKQHFGFGTQTPAWDSRQRRLARETQVDASDERARGSVAPEGSHPVG